jgi:transposase-like protein
MKDLKNQVKWIWHSKKRSAFLILQTNLIQNKLAESIYSSCVGQMASCAQNVNTLHVIYKTAWFMLQRIRKAMIEKDWDYKLSNIVETDEAFFGAPTRGGKRGRGTEKTKVIVSVSLTDDGHPVFAKMETVKKLDADTINAFAENNIEEGAAILSDGSSSYPQLSQRGYKHIGIPNSKADKHHLKWLHTLISNAKAFIEGTFHGLDKKHMDLYLAEFCFRFNRRFWPDQLFNRLVSACLLSSKISYMELTL